MASRLGESDEASTADTSTTVAIDDSTQTVADTLEDDTHPLSAGTSSDSLTAQITTPPAMETEQSREAETPESTGAVPANASSTAVSSSSPQGHSGSSYPIATLSDATSSTNLPPSPRTSIPAPIPEPIVTLADVSLSRRSSSSRYQTPLPPLPSIPAERQQQQQPLTAEQLTNVRDCPPSPPLPPYPLQLTATGAAQQLQSHNLPSLAQTEAQPSSQTDTPLPPAPPAPFAPPASPPTPRLPTQDLHPRQRSQQSQEFALPRWQPDSEVTYCPICSQQFSIFVRKHHCRKCGRVVCNSCSPHRITIPYPYIVQPPGSQPYQLQATQISPAGDVSRLGGGERVRLCNPCVPDPNNAPPASSPRAAAAAASTASGASSRHHSRSFGSAHSSSSQLNNAYISPTAAFGQGFFRSNTTPANSTLAESSTLAAPTASASQAQGRHHRHSVQIPNSAQGFGAMLREAYARSEVQAGTHPYGSNAGGASNNSIGQHQRHHHSRSHHTPAPPIAEEDECPVCRRELPQRELPDFEALREAHITQCIFTHSQYMGGGSPSTLSAPAPSTSLPTSPGEASTAAALASAAGAPAPPLRRTGMFPYRATEKDCVDDAECTICLEDFEVGVGMARLECFCRFHEQCILAWFVKHPGCCPVHQHDSFGY